MIGLLVGKCLNSRPPRMAAPAAVSGKHMDVIMYYLRKKGKYCDRITYNFTTTDLRFDASVKYMFGQVEPIFGSGGIFNQLRFDDTITRFMMGADLWTGRPWSDVDEVLMPIHVGQNHWVLGKFCLRLRKLFIYDSYLGRCSADSTAEGANEYAVILPYYLHHWSILSGRVDLLESDVYSVGNPLRPLSVEIVEGLPQQSDSDCGVFVLSFAEYLIEQKPFPDPFDVKAHRTRLAVSLYNHGVLRNENEEESDNEYVRPMDV